MANHLIRRLIPIGAILLVMVFVGFYYSLDFRYPPCCDTAISLVKAKEIAQTHQLNPLLPFNPSTATHAYSSLISTEIVTHLVLAVTYLVHPAWASSLAAAKILFLLLFLIPIIPLFFLARLLFRSIALSILTIIFTYFAFWYGNMYWSGHVAEYLGSAAVFTAVYLVAKIQRGPNWRLVIGLGGLLLLTFFIHVLSFLVVMTVSVTALAVIAWKRLPPRRKLLVPLAFLAYAFVFGLYLHFSSSTTEILPRFDINTIESSFSAIVNNSFGATVAIFLIVLGGYTVIRRRQITIISWLLMTYLLSQSSSLGTPFFAYRFNEFVVAPVAVLAIYGLQTVLTLLSSRQLRLAVAGLVMIVYLPLGLQAQNSLKQCYIHNCPGLNATQIPQADITAYHWLDTHAPATAVALGWEKFGYYLPVVTSQGVEFPTGEKRLIMTDPDPAVRYRLARSYHIRYIFWSAIFDRLNRDVVGAQDADETPFQTTQFFHLVYSAGGTRIYELQ